MNTSYIIPQKEVDAQNYYYFQNSFSVEELGLLEQNLEVITFQKGTTIGEHSDEIRSSQIKWIHQSHQHEWLYDKIVGMVLEANNNVWNFDLWNIKDSIQYTEYYASEKGHYDWHQDIGPNNLSQRKVSIAIQLNDDYGGGEFQIWQGGKSIQTLPKERGLACVFPSYMMHRVKPVTNGVRKSLVLWVGGGRLR